MYCTNCGKEIKDNIIYCGYCGVKINDSDVDKLENVGVYIGDTFISLGEMGNRQDRGWTYFYKGLDKCEKKEYREGIECFEKAVYYHPGLTNCYYNIALAYQELVEFENAIPWCEKFLIETPDDTTTIMDVAKLYNKFGKYDEALKLINKLIALEPNNPTHSSSKMILEQKMNSKK